MSSDVILVDNPAPGIRRVTLNRPHKRNALNHDLRGGIVRSLQEADADPDVRVMIVRGAGKCFSSGYDLGGGNEGQSYPWHTAGGDGHWPRHVTQGWMSIWELAKPVIAQVHGYCLAGGSELATCCDLVYMAEDAEMGYPAVRFGVADNHFHAWFVGMRKAMEMMLTGDSLSGKECVRLGWANACFPADQLEEKVLEVALRVASVPEDLVQLNKRVVHRQMEIMGLHTGIRVGSELCALGTHQKSMHEFLAQAQQKGLKGALQERDEPFGDYRTKEPREDD
ncbi:MAG: enoyl-CoA hydratase/isomerase family protein [Deltaproteobacteria bacterium]|nr:enoyl-CoA hydratase/isomerase family protein [Deltaproteobacteria bacterium]